MQPRRRAGPAADLAGLDVDGEGHLWVGVRPSSLVRVDPDTGQDDTVTLGGEFGGFDAAGDGVLYTVGSSTVGEVDLGGRPRWEVQISSPADLGTATLAGTDEMAWVMGDSGDRAPAGSGCGNGSCAASGTGAALVALSRVDGSVVVDERLDVPFHPRALVADGSGAWLTDDANGAGVAFVDLEGQASIVRLPPLAPEMTGNAYAVTAARDAIWVSARGYVARIDPAARVVAATIDLPWPIAASAMATDDARLWIAGGEHGLASVALGDGSP